MLRQVLIRGLGSLLGSYCDLRRGFTHRLGVEERRVVCKWPADMKIRALAATFPGLHETNLYVFRLFNSAKSDGVVIGHY